MTANSVNSLEDILRAHAARYPVMQPADAVKLIYQNEFGGGHLITDSEASLRYLNTEFSSVQPDSSVPLCENIGNGMARVMLAGLDTHSYPLEALNRDFVHSAELHTGNRTSFLDKLEFLVKLTSQAIFSFSSKELDDYLTGYAAAGYPPVSHSDEYRSAYHPAYRVILASRANKSLPNILTSIESELDRRRSSKHPLLVAIEGRCASGKSTLGAELQAICNCPLIHMDDFFLRPEQRTAQRLGTPGENIDHERFLSELLLPLKSGHPFEFRPFDCQTLTLTSPISVEPAPVVIVEGSYSCHPALRDYYDLKIFLTVPPEIQLDRIMSRNGEDGVIAFKERWIPLEESYFSSCKVEEFCDLTYEMLSL